MEMEELRLGLEKMVQSVSHPQEQAVNVLLAIQDKAGYVSDDGVRFAAEILGISPVKVEEVATFYNYIYREPVGKHVIVVCDSVICWLNGYITLQDYLSEKLNIALGETSSDGVFTLLPGCCLGYCDQAPAVLIDKTLYGNLTIEKIDELVNRFSTE